MTAAAPSAALAALPMLGLPPEWDRFQYLLLMAGCLLITLPLQLVLRARVYSRPRRLFAALVPVVALYSVWDVVGIVRDHWWYSERFTTGWLVPATPMPLEELVFFVVVPVCGLLTYGAVGTCLGWLRTWRQRRASSSGTSAPGTSSGVRDA